MELLNTVAPSQKDTSGREERKPDGRSRGHWLPSGADILFCAVLCAFAMGRGAVDLLDDGDPGWHISNGRHILATWSIPHRDYFSWTRAGHVWFAWEWLFDAIEGVLHHLGGLNAVVFLAAMLIALSYRRLFQEAFRRSGGDWLAAAGLTLVAFGAGAGHFLARPELVTVLLTVVWMGWLEGVAAGQPRFWRFPLLMLLWTNLHGGFIVGLALLLVYAAASGWEAWFRSGSMPGDEPRRRARRLGWCFGLCVAVTLVNPYGWRLHVHIVQYLLDRYQLNHITEFASPDFHVMAGRCFELLLVAGAWALYRGRRSVRVVDLLLMALAFQLGLMAVRNLDLAAVILTFVLSGVLGRERTTRPPAETREGLRRRFAAGEISRRLGDMELLPRWHWLPLLGLALGGWMVVHQGRLGSHRYLDAHFSEHIGAGGTARGFPVRAAGVLETMGTPPHTLTIGSWAGYLMYRLYPKFHPFYDGRSDFYGDDFTKMYLRAILARSGWSSVLDQEQVEWALLPPDLPLAAVLRESAGWRLVYADRNSLLFQRRGEGVVEAGRKK